MSVNSILNRLSGSNKDYSEYGLDSIISGYLSESTPSADPFFFHMLGIPGSGKTSYALRISEIFRHKFALDFTHVSFDKIMHEIPDYKSDADLAAAFSKFEIPARSSGYDLVGRLLEKRASIFFDHGGSVGDHVEILRYASKELGYRILLLYIKCTTDIAEARALSRSTIEGRHTPPNYISEREATISGLIPKYIEVSDRFAMIDNSVDRQTFPSEIVDAAATFFICDLTSKTGAIHE